MVFTRKNIKFLYYNFCFIFLALALSGCSGFSSVASNINPYWLTKGESKIPKDELEPKLVSITPSLLVQQYREQQQFKSDTVSECLLQTGNDYVYIVGPWDRLDIGVWNHPEFTLNSGSLLAQQSGGGAEQYLVQQDGTIFFPFVGQIMVAGKNVEQIRYELTQKLAYYVERPQVSVKVGEFRSKKAYVNGEVKEPGYIDLTNIPISIVDALRKVGGVIETGDKSRAVLTRDNKKYALNLAKLSPDLLNKVIMKQNDVLYVPDNKRSQVYMLGEIKNQGSIPLADGRLSLSEAISLSGGFNLTTVNTRGVFVIRGVDTAQIQPKQGNATVGQDKLKVDLATGLPANQYAAKIHGPRNLVETVKPTIFHLDAENAVAMVLANEFQLQPWDIVYVSSTKLTRWNRVLSQILPSVTSIQAMRNLAQW